MFYPCVAASSAQILGGSQKKRSIKPLNGSTAYPILFMLSEAGLSVLKQIVVTSLCGLTVTWNAYCHLTCTKSCHVSLWRSGMELPGNDAYESFIAAGKHVETLRQSKLFK